MINLDISSESRHFVYRKCFNKCFGVIRKYIFVHRPTYHRCNMCYVAQTSAYFYIHTVNFYAWQETSSQHLPETIKIYLVIWCFIIDSHIIVFSYSSNQRTFIKINIYTITQICYWNISTDKMDSILKMAFSNAFSLITIFGFQIESNRNMFLRVKRQGLVQIVAWGRKGKKPLSEPMKA